jgi:acetyltransferase-like isoleucine patch superfamily enzyme
MLLRCYMLFLAALILPIAMSGQEASSGISIPITISGDALYGNGAAAQDGESSSITGGVRAVVSPSVKLGAHWFIYSSVEVYSSPYFSYEQGLDNDTAVQAHVMQAFVGYTRNIEGVTFIIKAGQLSSAFGRFPLEYDDAKTPFVNSPPVYISNLPLRPDQRPCGVADLISQPYGEDVDFDCGGSAIERYGLAPVTLYGLPAVESDISWGRFDGRLQITNSSPANPQSLTSSSQTIEWTAGGGYTFPTNFHVGASAFRGPYLDQNLAPLLPQGKSIRDFAASGIGIDAQWARGPWSAEGEWQHFQFDLPGFIVSPSENAGYAQVKRILTPRAFLAVRASAQRFGRVQDTSGVSASTYQAPQYVDELSFGYRFSRQELLKVGFNWTARSAWYAYDWMSPASHGYGVQVQLVTSFTAFQRAFR